MGRSPDIEYLYSASLPSVGRTCKSLLFPAPDTILEAAFENISALPSLIPIAFNALMSIAKHKERICEKSASCAAFAQVNTFSLLFPYVRVKSISVLSPAPQRSSFLIMIYGD